MLLDYTFLSMVLGIALIAIASGLLGVFALLRDQSLLGDAISHAMLPGIVCAFLLTHSKNPFILLLGGMISGVCGALIIPFVSRKTPIKKDAALGLVLSVFFGTGLMLLTVVQKKAVAGQAILHTFLLGNAATLLREDIVVMAFFVLVLCVMIIVLWKELVATTFDPVYAQVAGFSTRLIDHLLIGLLVCAIAVGLQTVGVVLMSSMIIAPAAAARQWVSRLASMVMLAIFFGLMAGIGGCIMSASIERMPTGPAIVILLSVIVLCSLLCAPHRGILWRSLHAQRHQ